MYLTAKAVDELSSAVINQTGVIRAQTLATGAKGEILLIADMKTGTANIGGTLDASAPNGGDGGFIETSGATVNTQAGAAIHAGSAFGRGGEWLVDPYDYVIGAAQATTISTTLNGGTNVTISTAVNNSIGSYTPASGSGDITVSSAISKTAGGDASLTLRADRNITVNAPITSTSGKLNLTLSAGNDLGSAFGGVLITSNIASNGGDILVGGAGGNLAAARTVTNGIGYARNYSASTAAVTIDPLTANAITVASGGGNITINGYSTTNPSGNGDGTGIRVRAGSVIDSGYYGNGTAAAPVAGGNIRISGHATANTQFGIQFDQNTGQSLYKTTVATSPVSGNIVVDGNNLTNPLYALALSNPGNQGNLYFAARSTADLLVLINGNPSVATFQATPPNSGCRVGYPNCGTFEVPGANGSYQNATFNAVIWSTNNIYIRADASGSKVYDGTTDVTGLVGSNLSCSGILANCTQTILANNGLWSFRTASPDAGSYTVLTPTASTYTTGGTTYQLGYFFLSGSYGITPKPLGIAVRGNYNGSTTLAAGGSTQVLTTGLAPTDTLTAVTIASANVADNGSNYVTALSGTTTNGTGRFRSGNYSLASVNYTLANGETLGSAAPANQPTTSTNAVHLNAAVLVGLAVSGTYNGTNVYSSSTPETVISVSGLPVGEQITQVRVNSTEVASNGSNYVTAILAGTSTNGTFLASNYSFAGSANYTLSDNSIFNGSLSGGVTPVVGSTNAVFIRPAPLGIAAAPVYNGSNSFTIGGGLANNTNGTIDSGGGVRVAGLVNGQTLAGFTLLDKNVGFSGNRVDGVSISGGIDARNYVIHGGVYGDAANVLAGSTGTPSTNVAAVTAASLGVSVSGTYNGTGAFDSGNSTIQYTGTVNGERVTAVTVASADVSANTSNRVTGATGDNGFDIGNYQLAPTRTVAVDGNGAITSGNNTATVSRAPLAVSLQATYSGTTTVTPGQGTSYSGWVTQQAPTITSATLSDRNVATAGKYVTSLSDANGVVASALRSGANAVTLTSPNGGNYYLSGSYTPAGSATPNSPLNTAALAGAALGVSVSGTYNGTGAFDSGNSTIQYTGTVNGERVTAVTVASADVSANTSNRVTGATGDNGFDIGNYQLAPTRTVAVDGNGAITSGNNTATVSRAPLAVSLQATYSGTTTVTPGQGTSYSGWVTQQAPTITSATLSDRNVATAGKYVTSLSDANGVVASALRSGANAVTLTSPDGGNYYLSGSYTPAGSATPNSPLNTAALARATLTVSGAQAQDKVYDGNLQAQITGGTLSGLLAQDSLGVAGGGTFDTAHVGNGKPVSAALTLTGTASVIDNYALVQPTGLAAAVTPRALAASLVGDLRKVYDGGTGIGLAPANFALTGFVQGEGADVFVATGQFNSPHVSQASTVTATLAAGHYTAGANTRLSNYALPTSASGPGTITPAMLTYVADPVRVTAGAPTPPYTGRVTGFVGGDTLSSATTGTLLFTGPVVGIRDLGSFPITGSGLAANFGNYAFVQAPANASALTVDGLFPPPPPSPVIVPAFIDNGSAALAQPTGTSFGGLNYVSLGTGATPQAAAAGTSTPAAGTSLGTASTGIASTGSPSTGTASTGASATGTAATGATASAASGGAGANANANGVLADGSATANEAVPLTTDSAPNEVGTLSFVSEGQDGRRAASELNVNNVTVNSASRNLDVIVIGTGVNRGAAATAATPAN